MITFAGVGRIFDLDLLELAACLGSLGLRLRSFFLSCLLLRVSSLISSSEILGPMLTSTYRQDDSSRRDGVAVPITINTEIYEIGAAQGHSSLFHRLSAILGYPCYFDRTLQNRRTNDRSRQMVSREASVHLPPDPPVVGVHSGLPHLPSRGERDRGR